jgi:hypothetical protein
MNLLQNSYVLLRYFQDCTALEQLLLASFRAVGTVTSWMRTKDILVNFSRGFRTEIGNGILDVIQ